MEAYAQKITNILWFWITNTPPIIIATYIVLFGFVYHALNMLEILFRAKLVSRRKVHFERILPEGKKVLFAGDSTAVGTGAYSAEDTLAGRFAHDFPHTSINNTAVNGALTIDILKQFEVVKNTQFDLIIISTGGNDIWAFKTLRKIRKDLSMVLEEAIRISDHRVILVFFGNEGSAPLFPLLIRPLLMRRTAKVNQIFIDVAIEKQVPLVELFSNKKENPFVENPKKYFAKDRLHPSSDGYWRWYKGIWYFMTERKYLYND